ncbi:hypothetical protein DBT_1972 [Dissulfuribacter thermophilus]|uniref:BioF2-like acetyltransferase domain-containing protein n=1 Tax=Dissulfuribacter thermophilus TaxID=1156395 RepID=A0A1B9F3Y8_9BACT|nr:GNAT family N-acetyltransferase [Dissulfuribacter thermophilus]OCC14657.1 hypothetical protein DBT_1972 [Dissulfuribacter thermophilus]
MCVENFIETEVIDITNYYDYITYPDLFLHSSWLKAIEEGLGFKSIGLLTKFEEIPVCLSIFLTAQKAGAFRLAGAPLPGCFTPHLEPVWLKEVDDTFKVKIIEMQNRFLIKDGFSYIERRFRDDLLVKKIGNKKGYEIKFPETFILEIKDDLDTMWKTMEGRSRNMVRKAEKKGVKLVKGEGNVSEIEMFYEMLKIVFAKSNSLPPHPLSLYKSIVKNLMPENRVLILSSVLNDEVIAMGFFIYDDSEIHFLSGASLPEAYKTGANNFIQWNVIKFAVNHGLKLYDLGGKGIPSIDKFKASFGGKSHKYGKIVWRSKKALIAEKIYRNILSFKSKLKV